MEIPMNVKTLIAVAVAGAFAAPLAAQASVDGDNLIIAQAAGSGAGGATSTPQRGSQPPGPASPGTQRPSDHSANDSSTSGSYSISGSSPRSGSEALHDRLDKNKDGYVSRDEARDATELQGRFAELDKDNDGKISRGEIRALDSDRTGAAVGTTGTPKRDSGSYGGSK
jgi:hypothetical protein